MMLRSLTLCLLLLSSLAPAASYAAEPSNGGDGLLLPADVARLRGQAANCVVVVDDGVVGRATAFLAYQDLEQNKWYFVTCFHVVNSLKNCSLKFIGNNGAVEVANMDDDFFADPKRDLVVIRATIIKDLKPRLQPLFGNLNKAALSPAKPNAELLACGYPGFQNSFVLYDSKLRLGPEANASDFGLKDAADDNRHFVLRAVQEEPTIAGMSGGIVVDAEYRLAGVVVARLPDTVSFLISPATVLDTLRLSLAPNAFRNYAGANLANWQDNPYPKSSESETKFKELLGARSVTDSVSWELVSRWQELFKGESRFREQFQNIKIDLSKLVSDKINLNPQNKGSLTVLHIDGSTFRDAAYGLVRVWINGNPHDISKDSSGVGCDISLDSELAPGVNLLVISRKAATTDPVGVNADAQFRLNRLFQSMPLDGTILYGGTPVYTFHRELPALFDSYSVDLQLIPAAAPPVARVNRGNLRVGLNLDYLAKLMSANPISYSGLLNDPMMRSRVEVKIAPVPGTPEVSFEPGTDQSFGIRFNALVTMSKFQAHYGGLTFKPAPTTQQGAPDFPPRESHAGGTFLILDPVKPGDPIRTAFRFSSGSVGEVSLPLTPEIVVDAGVPISEILIAQLNSKLDNSWVWSEQPRGITPDRARAAIDCIYPGLFAAKVPISVVDSCLDGQGWLLVDLQVGAVGKMVDGQQPTSLEIRDDERNATGVLVIHGVEKEIIRTSIAKHLTDNWPGLFEMASSSSVNSRCKVFVDIPPTLNPTVNVNTGDLTPWTKALSEWIQKSSHLEVHLESSAKDFQESIAKQLKGVEVNPSDPGPEAGVVSTSIDRSRISWKADKLRCCADSIKLDSVKMKGVTLNISGMDFAKIEASDSLSGNIEGAISIDSLDVGGQSVLKSIKGEFQVILASGDGHHTEIRVKNLKGALVVLDEPVDAGSANLTLEDGKLSGDIAIGPVHVKVKP